MGDWLENAEEQVFIEESENGKDPAERLLEISSTNRTIATREQGIILAGIRITADYYNCLSKIPRRYDYLNRWCDFIEAYQLTMDGEQNSRRQFIRVLSAQLVAEMHKLGKDGATQQISK